MPVRDVTAFPYTFIIPLYRITISTDKQAVSYRFLSTFNII